MAIEMTDPPTTVVMYRYRVVETWGALAAWSPGRHLLEHEWCGKEHQWNIWSDTEGSIVGGAVGVYVDKVEVCPCGKFLTTKEHEWPMAILSGRKKAIEEAIAAVEAEGEAFRNMLDSYASLQDSILRLARLVVEADHIGASEEGSDSTTQGQQT